MNELGALQPIVARKAMEVETLRCGAAALWAAAQSLPPARPLDLLRGGTVIAEMKRRSPSGGELRQTIYGESLAKVFAEAGAAALSVLTDGPAFGGSLDDLASARRGTNLPLLRKDFVVDPVQVAEARVGGADWVLLIAAVLDDSALETCLEAVERSHAAAIVEVHDESELERVMAAGVACVGINNRDLRTLRTDLETFSRLRRRITDTTIVIAESGARSPDDVARLAAEGADAVLVGEALMRADSPSGLLQSMVSAARRAPR
ncbi:MAG: indole-3-glycerol-phosphate synthase [Candidatus Dormibacteraeota bacterium]|nr:indole-3-glycerol-phosphate synthase [Candidatus Dormibacteraeota bacterium]